MKASLSLTACMGAPNGGPEYQLAGNHDHYAL